MNEAIFTRLSWAALLLVFAVVVLSAGMRLAKIGAGCEPWPACYGQLREAEDGGPAMAAARVAHRLAAAVLGIVVIALAVLGLAGRGPDRRPWLAPALLLLLTVFLAVLGRWSAGVQTPAVVLGNLLGGMAMLAVAGWLAAAPLAGARPGPRGGSVLALVVLALQIALGGLTSAELAGAACPDLPGCAGRWLPELGHLGRLSFWQPPALPAHEGQAALHLLHRLGAVLSAAVIGLAGLKAMDRGGPALAVGLAILALLAVQAGLGAAAVMMDVPLTLALMHNAVAALLLLVLTALLRVQSPVEKRD